MRQDEGMDLPKEDRKVTYVVKKGAADEMDEAVDVKLERPPCYA
jgi:hypothetical protein